MALSIPATNETATLGQSAASEGHHPITASSRAGVAPERSKEVRSRDVANVELRQSDHLMSKFAQELLRARRRVAAAS
eukprot:2564919-Alexandrium_andersonii.AAC.1